MVERKCSLWILVLVVANVWAANVWDGSVATSFAAGEGTAASPYQISNGAELALFAQKVTAGATTLCAVLTDDIYLNENSENYAEWGEKPPVNHWSTPIGLAQKQYQGVFDGKGHKVYGAYLDTGFVAGYNGIGFFGTIGASATVKNLSVEQSYFAVQGEINNNPHIGIFVGVLSGGKLENVSANGFVYSNVNNTTTSAMYSEVGCLIGYATGSSAAHSAVKNAIANCKIVAAIEKGSTGGNYHSIGGLIGKMGELTRVENVYSRSSLKHASKTAVAGLYYGGIVGNMALNTDTLYNAYYNISEVGETNAPQAAVGSTGGVRSNVLGKLTVNMKSEDFANVLGTSFTYTAKQNDGYPQLVVFEGDSAFEGGDGSEDKPFLVGSAKSLRAVSGLVNGMNDVYASKSYRMVDDVVLNEGDDASTMTYLWEPVGVSDKITFEGRFDGAGKSIYGLIVPGKYIYAGLFGVIGANGIVENLSIRDSKISGIAVAGAFAGWNIGLIRYCSNYSLVDSYSTTRSVYAAGIVAGIRQGGRVEYCSNYGKIHADAAGATLHGYAGGIASENIGLISRSINEGEIACDAYAGGIASYNYLGTIENSINTGKVDSQNKALAAKYNDSNMAKYSSAGGICAINKANSTVVNSYSISNAVIGSKIAQIVAENSGTIDNCYFASGKVSGANVYSANSGTVTNSAAELVGRMKTGAFALVLGNAYKQDDAVNDGYPTFLAEGETFGSANLFEGGDGSEGKPFLIATATQLRNMEYLVNKKNKEYGASHYKLIADISLNENSENYINWHKVAPANSWTPMGSDTTVGFKGVFDGNEFSIGGIYANAKFSGLFGVIDTGAVVKNLTIKESYITTTNRSGMVGSVAGYGKEATLENVVNEGDVLGLYAANVGYDTLSSVGGIIGRMHGGIIKNVSNKGNVKGMGTALKSKVSKALSNVGGINVGGITGIEYKGVIENASNFGSVLGRNYSMDTVCSKVAVGGITGGLYEATLNNVQNSGELSIQGADSAKAALSWPRMGGIAGCAYSSKITKCLNSGNMTGYVSTAFTTSGTSIALGGIIGRANSGEKDLVVRQCKNEGDINSTSKYAYSANYAGGLVGFIDNAKISIENSYATGKLNLQTTETSNPKTAVVYAGGLVGNLNKDGYIKGSYFSGTILNTVSASTKDIRVGGVAGTNAGTIIGSYFDKTVAGITNVAGTNAGTLTKVLALTTEEMQTNEFAWKLNTLGGDAENAGVFTRYNDYPVFADESYLPIYRVVFDDEVKIYNHYTSHKGYVDAPAEPEPAPGELFVGWTDGDKYMLQNRQVISKDMTLYALFTLVTEPVYFITFVDGSDVYVKATENTGMIKTLPTAKNIPMGHHFDGWFDNVTNKEVTTETIFTGIATVVAKYSTNLYKIMFLDYDGSEISSLEEPYGKMPTVPKAPVREPVDGTGYKFTGWDSEVAIVTGEASYKAVYESYEIVSSSSAKSSSSSEKSSSSSSDAKSSSSSANSSSSSEKSSSSDAKSSSSSVESSSSETVVSSSSSSRKDESSSSSAKSSSSSVVSSSSSEKLSSSSSEAKSSSSSVKSSSSTAKSSSSSVKSSSSTAKSSSSSVKSSSSSSTAKSSSSSVKSSSSSSKAKSSSSSNKAKSSSSKSKSALPVIAQMPHLKITTLGRDVQISGASEGVAYDVLDLQGRVVMQGSANAANFNLSMPRAGHYLVRVGARQKLVAVK
ncbi:repeat domain (List_Bact_rpt) [Fibrobacter sp. UWB16]|uniref:hypothetical protein n=1 Tax=Fibrobacter sp. UWB16 TaxID=1945874 RepID=UPI000BC8A9C7|nr:hypothetical protein [Fibrobacter sp. UWB16]SOD13975.1 repeat domain (List_Bact_rpt) [Fibrobacter sp. UWB16]